MNDVVGSLFANIEQVRNSVGNVRSLARLARLMAAGSCGRCSEELSRMVSFCEGLDVHVPYLRETLGFATIRTINGAFQKRIALDGGFTIQTIAPLKNALLEIETTVRDKIGFPIGGMIRPSDLEDCTMLFLDASRLDVQWEKPPSVLVNPMEFRTATGVVHPRSLRFCGTYPIYDDDSITAVKIAYGSSSALSIVFIVPKVQHKTTSTVWNKLHAINQYATTDACWITVPCFQITSLTNIVPVFSCCGVTSVFTLGKADFGLAVNNAQGDFVKGAIQKCCIEFDEIGTRATTVSYAGVSGCQSSYVQPRQIHFDRPFCFAIMHNDTVLMIGKVTNPIQ